jgi:hypothetical protein
MELDEFERGYPRLTLSLLMDVVGACLALADRGGKDGALGRGKKLVEETAPSFGAFTPCNAELRTPEGLASLRKRIHSADAPGHVISWRALLGRQGRLHRLKVFDGPRTRFLNYKDLLQPGHVSIFDLSDSGAPRS